MSKSPLSDIDRFMNKVHKTETCWNWTGHLTKGYGQFRVGFIKSGAHRWLYQYLHGPVSQLLHLDHLCRNRSCVNYFAGHDHLSDWCFFSLTNFYVTMSYFWTDDIASSFYSILWKDQIFLDRFGRKSIIIVFAFHVFAFNNKYYKVQIRSPDGHNWYTALQIFQ